MSYLAIARIKKATTWSDGMAISLNKNENLEEATSLTKLPSYKWHRAWPILMWRAQSGISLLDGQSY